VLKRAAKPIDCSTPAPPPGPDTYDAGGCAVSSSRTRAWEWLLGAAIAIVTLRRRKK